MFFGGDPFGGGMGGMPERREVDTTALYEVLGVPKTATKAEIKKAYFQLARKHHPDKGGDADTFKKMSAAWDVLQDDEKRKVYDERGLEGLEGGGGGGGAEDIFSMFFGGGGGRRRRSQGPRKVPMLVLRVHQF
jgi:DnaJ family protein A protein 2